MKVMELTSLASQQVYRQRADSLILTSKDSCPLEQCFPGVRSLDQKHQSHLGL